MTDQWPQITLVLPYFNEEQNLPVLYRQLREITAGLPYRFTFLFVSDGSTDGSTACVLDWVKENQDVLLVELSRNFGQQTAVFAGLQHAGGDAVIVMDTDLQDRPAAIGDFLRQWEGGAQVVYAVRQKRKENAAKRLLFSSFYKILARLADIPIPMEAGLFGLMDRRVVELLAAMPEGNRYIPGLRAWAGFTQVGVTVERDERGDEKPRASVITLFKLAMDAIFSFSRLPLRLATAMGLLSALLAIVATAVVLYSKFVTLKAIPGWTSILLSIFYFGAIQLITIGIIGEYLGRIYEEVKRRPPYAVRRIVRHPGGEPGGADR